MNQDNLLRLARAVIDTEAEAVQSLKARIDETFLRACRCLLDCRGRVIVMGMGKSGHIGNKIAATFASTGTPAFFVHPGEASHGDLGMVTAQDVVLALSNSGETEEILRLLPVLRRLGVSLIALTGRPESTLAREADVALDVSVNKEACPLGLAPTASTTATLVMGDALAVALLEQRGFTAEDFALSHPGGALGRRLLLRVRDVMHAGERVPRVPADAGLREALVEMSRKGLGMTTVLDETGRLLGVFTDGDLRRAFDANADLHDTRVATVMTRHPRSCRADILAAEALKLMEDASISALVVVDEVGQVIGALSMHDLLRAGVA